MVSRAVTQSDLNSLEIRVKSEIKKENLDERHNLDNKLWVYYYKVDELEKNVAVNDNILKNMADNFQELKQMVKDWFFEVKQEIKGMDSRFSTKEEYHASIAGIQELRDTHKKIVSWLIGSVGTVFLAFLGLIIKTLWLK